MRTNRTFEILSWKWAQKKKLARSGTGWNAMCHKKSGEVNYKRNDRHELVSSLGTTCSHISSKRLSSYFLMLVSVSARPQPQHPAHELGGVLAMGTRLF